MQTPNTVVLKSLFIQIFSCNTLILARKTEETYVAMGSNIAKNTFSPINTGYGRTFKPGLLTLGLVVPIENYAHSPVPDMVNHMDRVRTAEALGFSAVWLRDVPFNVPSFGDAGQVFDPFVYLGALAAQTQNISLAVASIILPLRHPAHVAKAAATADVLSDGRLILGVASGDRPEEYPALNTPFEERGDRFRDSYEYIRSMAHKNPSFDNAFGSLNGHMDMLPKPVSGQLPMLITGSSQQSPDWVAEHTDGWITYPRSAEIQSQLIREYRQRTERLSKYNKPVMEPLYIDLMDDPDATPRPIHLGIKTGVHHLVAYLKSREEIGVNHIALNLRFNQKGIDETLRILSDKVLPHFQQ